MEGFIRELRRSPLISEALSHYEVFSEQGASLEELPDGVSPSLRQALEGQGIRKLYSHQAEAIEKVFAGENVALITPTASGKTLAYNVPVFERLLRDPGARALYLFPLKALAQDQLSGAEELLSLLPPSSPRPEVAVYDGDTSPHRRERVRLNAPRLLISNPDMLHHGILPHHDRWAPFLEGLKFVVVDELHTYRGVFGTHIAQVLRRLLRVASLYGASPQLIACSATLANAAELARELTGLPFSLVERNGAPRPRRHFLLLNPTLSPNTLASRLFSLCLSKGLKTIAFTKARRTTELIFRWTLSSSPSLLGRISSYRAGFLPEERREIERELREGRLLGVVSTSALEMGIDIGGLDVAILVGYPGSIINTWQRGGRAGRGERESLTVLIAGRDALDQYFARHPEDFLRRGYERAVIDPKNREILKEHLPCAASEEPLRDDDLFFPQSDLRETLEELEREGKLLRSADGRTWHSARRRPHRFVDLRAAGESFTILREGGTEVIGTVSGLQALSECHPGAIYLHRGEQFLIRSIDLAQRNALAVPAEVGYFTRARSEKETEILGMDASRPLPGALLKAGRLRVTTRITGYEKRSAATQALLSLHPLELPPLTFETRGIWLELPREIKGGIEARGLHFMGSIHAVEHGVISLFPLYALCERDDIGGISFTFHHQVGGPAVFIYDGYPGGVGLARRAYEVMEELLTATREVIAGCPCEGGCPSCVHSPKCGSGNVPLDKEGAALSLRLILGEEPLGEVAPEEEPPLEFAAETTSSQKEEKPDILFFDLETKRSASEVGGWQNTHLMGLAVGVCFEERTGHFSVYSESEIDKLIQRLKEADLIIGFNLLGFDYGVLRGYSSFDFSSLPTLDILREVYSRLGFRVSLGNLAEATLGEGKTADGLQALAWWKEGEIEKVVEYCRRDVSLTRELFHFGAREGHILFTSKDRGKLRLPADWGEEIKKVCRSSSDKLLGKSDKTAD